MPLTRRKRRSADHLPPWSDNPPNAAWLLDWQKKHGYSDAAAARALGLSVPTFRRQRSGISPVSEQTARIAHYVTVHREHWLDVAEVSTKLARGLTKLSESLKRTERGRLEGNTSNKDKMSHVTK